MKCAALGEERRTWRRLSDILLVKGTRERRQLIEPLILIMGVMRTRAEGLKNDIGRRRSRSGGGNSRVEGETGAGGV